MLLKRMFLNAIQSTSRDGSTAIAFLRSSTLRILAAMILRVLTVRVVPRTCLRRKFGIYSADGVPPNEFERKLTTTRYADIVHTRLMPARMEIGLPVGFLPPSILSKIE